MTELLIFVLADDNNIFIIEDAAQAIDNYFITGDNKTPLGSIGDLATFSFHETKNISSGEGGMLVINNPNLFKRAEIIWEKGTNRSAFSRGEIELGTIRLWIFLFAFRNNGRTITFSIRRN